MIGRLVLAGFLFANVMGAQLISVPPRRVVAKLGVCSDGSPKLVAVTDGASSTDCSLGAGSLEVLCFCHDGSWTAGGVGPQGEPGAQGATGQAATISVGSTTTGAPGSSSSVSNAGSSSAAVLNFLIPRGDVGAQGVQGAAGATGATGATGSPGVVSATLPLSLSSGVLSIGTFPAGSGASCATGLRVGASSCFWEVSSGDFLIATGSKNIVELNYGGSTSAFFQTLQAPNFKVDPAQNPPYACDSSKRGSLYFDDNSNTFCGCTGASWMSLLGPGPCA